MFNLFLDLDLQTITILAVALSCVLFYEAINGFHDAANVVATVVYTKTLKEKYAIIGSGIFNFLGVFLGGLSVAYAIVHLLPTDTLLKMNSNHGLIMIFSILLAAIVWNLGTWYFAIPTSSSHTLIGSIIGVGLANAFISNTSLVTALNIPQMKTVLLALIISPFVGLLLAGITIVVLRRNLSSTRTLKQLFMSPTEYKKIYGKNSPPSLIKWMLMLSSAAVSFYHGANDGQKGIGLLMLVLIALAPASFAVNINASHKEIVNTRNSIAQIGEYFDSHKQAIYVDNSKQLNEYRGTTLLNQSNDYHCNCTNLFATVSLAKSLFDSLHSFRELDTTQRFQTRCILMRLSDTLTKISNQPSMSVNDKRYLKQLQKDILVTVEYAPLWITMAIATALSVGTMIGWRRVTTTIGEKIGKKDMNYAQGLSAQFTTALSIGLASSTGIPISTTQLLSSSVAGTMLADNNGGIQSQTIKNIVLTWLLTLPMTILLSASLFALAHWLI